MSETNSNPVQKLKKFAQKADNYLKNQSQRIKSELEFVGGKQYSKEDVEIRGEHRAELTFNLTRQYCNQIINSYRKKPFGITISARKQESVQKANIAQAIIRGWEQVSGMSDKVVEAVDRQVKAGIGYVVLSNDYASNDGWDQDIKIQSIIRPDMVIADPFDKSVDGGDANECAFVEHVSEEVAEQMYGDDEHDEWARMSCPLDDTAWNAPEDSVALVTYFVLKKSKTKIYQDSDGNTLRQDQVRKNTKMKSRETYKTTVCVYKIIGDKVVSETEIPLSRLPIIPFRGEMIDVDGKTDWVGITHFAKDPARLINWTASLTAERVSISPKTSRIVDMNSIINYKDVWQQANRLNLPYLPYDSMTKEGVQVPAPVTDNPAIDISAPVQAQTNYQQLLSGILGMSEAGVMTEQVANETATAVLTRSRSTEVANYQFIDNAAKSVKAIGKVLLEMLNIVYDTERLMPIVTDDERTMTNVNVAELDIIPSELEVNVDAGPMQETQRKENLNGLLALGSMLGPEAALIFASDIVANSDFDNAEAVATKLESYAKIKTGIGADVSQEQDPEAVAALQQAQQTVQTLQEQLSQQQLYIQQQGALLADKSLELQIAREKMQWDYKKAIDVEAMKLQGAQTLQTQELQSKAEVEAMKASNQVDVELSKQPDTVIVQGAQPTMGSIAGQRNDLFK